MNFDFHFPDISRSITKSAAKKPRRVGDLRIGSAVRDIRKHYDLTEEKTDEDRGVTFYSLGSADREGEMLGRKVSRLGCALKNKKVWAIFADFGISSEEIKKDLTAAYGAPDEVPGGWVWADTVTTIFLTGAKGEVILCDTQVEAGCTAMEEIHMAEEDRQRGFVSRLWHDYGDPVGRVSRAAYIPRMLAVGIPAAIMFAFTWARPEYFVGDANIFIIGFMILGTLCFISLISLMIRRLSDIGKSHLWYWGFFAMLFLISQYGDMVLGDKLLATRLAGVIFFAALLLLACFSGEPRRNKYGPVQK